MRKFIFYKIQVLLVQQEYLIILLVLRKYVKLLRMINFEIRIFDRSKRSCFFYMKTDYYLVLKSDIVIVPKPNAKKKNENICFNFHKHSCINFSFSILLRFYWTDYIISII